MRVDYSLADKLFHDAFERYRTTQFQVEDYCMHTLFPGHTSSVFGIGSSKVYALMSVCAVCRTGIRTLSDRSLLCRFLLVPMGCWWNIKLCVEGRKSPGMHCRLASTTSETGQVFCYHATVTVYVWRERTICFNSPTQSTFLSDFRRSTAGIWPTNPSNKMFIQ